MWTYPNWHVTYWCSFHEYSVWKMHWIARMQISPYWKTQQWRVRYALEIMFWISAAHSIITFWFCVRGNDHSDLCKRSAVVTSGGRTCSYAADRTIWTLPSILCLQKLYIGKFNWLQWITSGNLVGFLWWISSWCSYFPFNHQLLWHFLLVLATAVLDSRILQIVLCILRLPFTWLMGCNRWML